MSTIVQAESVPATRISRRNNQGNAWSRIARFCGFFALALIYIPVVWLGIMSVSAEPLSGRPYPMTFNHYELLFANTNWHAPFLNSILLGLTVSVACMICGTFVARSIVALARPGPVVMMAVLPLFVP